MVENKNDTALIQKNADLDMRIEQNTLANQELRKVIEQMAAEIGSLKSQIDGTAAERADVDAQIEAQNQLEKQLKNKSEELQRQIETMRAEVDRLGRVADDKFKIDDF